MITWTRKDEPPPPPAYFIGLDLGTMSDHSAVAVDEVTVGDGALRHAIRYLLRWPLGISYVDVVRDVGKMVATTPLIWPELIIDATGVGGAVCDLFAESEVAATMSRATITTGTAITAVAKGWHIAKTELVGTMQAALSSGRLKVASELEEAATLKKELAAFKVKVTPAGNESFASWREKDHDDLCFAVMLAVWLAERRGYTVPSDEPPLVVGGKQKVILPGKKVEPPATAVTAWPGMLR